MLLLLPGLTGNQAQSKLSKLWIVFAGNIKSLLYANYKYDLIVIMLPGDWMNLRLVLLGVWIES